ncbi:hypothetical protein K492DRAFT_194770 [Lichtheimia hyalospora FSU 10163]|nr:hypothetical protein K492DRAFT_194770 [Lichtheimia hyalospora FSU 10163]
MQQQNTDQNQTSMPSGRRRSSLWEKLTGGALHASQQDTEGIKHCDAAGFAPAGAKFDETFGGSALYETGMDVPHHSDKWKRDRTKMAEDALRQMS